MNKPFILCVLAALAAFGQSQTPLTITQSAGSATGELRMQERRTNGQDYVGIRAPQSVAANTVWTLPSADGTSGQCLQTDGSGQWGWAACIINGGNTTGATLTIGTNDAQTLSLETNGTGRWSIPITGHLYAGANNTYDIGAGLSANSPRSIYAATSIVTPKIGRDSSASLTIMTDSADRWIYTSAGMITPAATDAYDIGNLTTPLRVRGIYGKIVDTALGGGTGDYLQTRKIQLFDNTGSSTGASYWDLNVVMSGVGAGQNSYFYLRDNAGSNVFKSERIASGVAVSRTTWYTDLLPDTDGGRSMGTQLLNWDKVYANQLGDSSYPVVVWGANSDFSGLNTTALTINTGAATVGYVWTATSTGGAGSWQAAGGGSSLPVVDTTGIAKGSSDATKIVRFEVDGFTSGTTRTLTPQNDSYTIAGINIAQTFSATQTHSADIASSSANANNIGSGATPFGYMAAQYMSAEQHRIVNPASSHGTYWDWRLQSASAIRLYSGSGTQIEMDISVLSSTNTQVGIRGSIYPTSTSGSNGDIGYSGAPWRSQYLSTSAYMNGTQWMDSSRNLTNLGTGTFSGAITANGGIATGSATNSTLYVGLGNLYLRTYSGANPSCLGITNGWVGYRTDTDELQICSGGNLKVVGLL